MNYKLTLSNAKHPKREKEGDIGLDLFAATKMQYENFIEYDTGVALEIPKGFAGLVFPRSSISNTNLSLCNSVGLIDNNFRGSIKLRFRLLNNSGKSYDIGDKIGQLVLIPWINFPLNQVDELSDSNRGNKGFGSTGK